MPQTPHVERHFTGSATVRDIVIGMSDGLTVPFALAAGLSGAVDNTSIIVTAGLAEIAAGSIAMGLGGYLAARSDAEYYDAERVREETEVREKAKVEAEEVADVFRAYGLTSAELKPVVDALRKRPEAWVDFMMRFELGLEAADGDELRWAPLTLLDRPAEEAQVASSHRLGGEVRQQAVRNPICLGAHSKRIDGAFARGVSEHPAKSNIRRSCHRFVVSRGDDSGWSWR